MRHFQATPYIADLFAAEAMHIMTLEAMLSPENIKEQKTKSFLNFYIYLCFKVNHIYIFLLLYFSYHKYYLTKVIGST